MRKTTKLVILVAIVYFVQLSQVLANNDKSLSKDDYVKGKWLLTISVGGFNTQESTLKLRNVLKNVFTTVKGGLYQHEIDLDDKTISPDKVNRNSVLKSFEQFNKTVKGFKLANPQKPTMVIIGLTGHGKTDQYGEFFFSLSQNTVLNGHDFVDLLENLDVDEVIVILQSCKSGSLVHNYFENSMSKYFKNMTKNLQNKGKKIAVITPASQWISSPSGVWEDEILNHVFYDSNADIDDDGIVTYGEWKQRVRAMVCSHESYQPAGLFLEDANYKRKPMDVGIDPQFFDVSIPLHLPIYLTDKGMELWKKNLLIFPNNSNSPTQDGQEIENLCKRNEKYVRDILSWDYNQMFNLIDTHVGEDKKNLLIYQMTHRDLSIDFNEQNINFLYKVYKSLKHASQKANVLKVLSRMKHKESENILVDSIIDDLRSHFESEEDQIKKAIIGFFTTTKAQSAYELLKPYFQHKSADFRMAITWYLEAINYSQSTEILSEYVVKDSEPYVRHGALRALGIGLDPSSIMPLIHVLKYDPIDLLRAIAATYLGERRATEALNDLIEVAKKDPSDYVKAQAKLAIDKILGIVPEDILIIE